VAELVPYPFPRLISRMFRELEADGSIFDLPRKKFVLGDPELDFSVSFHDKPASTPLGPAAGPQSQLAQNLVLSFLGGGRIMELKTVQIMDELKIPRPCIDMQTVGYNVEWSQELKLEQSLEEYVKGSMLIEILVASGKIPFKPGFTKMLIDMSVGYDLKGIQNERVVRFIEGMMDATDVVERLRAQIPDEWRQYRDLEFTTALSDTLTLSTFHGCPPDEIERILDFLLKRFGLHCIVKLNPTLLGKDEARRIFGDVLGYRDHIPDTAFEKDTKWEQAVDFVGRLGETAKSVGSRFGVKFSNTLIVENRRDFFPKTEKEMYLSGLPLHVLAMALVARFRKTFGDAYPVSFSAGIDRANFAEAATLGLVPITTCSDLLKPGGYGRMSFYFLDLAKRMKACGAADLDELVILGRGTGEEALMKASDVMYGAGSFGEATRASLIALHERTKKAGAALDGPQIRRALAEPMPRCCVDRPDAPFDDLRAGSGALFLEWVRQAKVLNSARYSDTLLTDPRYPQSANLKLPPKVGTKLALFNCITCDKCVPVCPNDANFTYTLPAAEIPVMKVKKSGAGWERTTGVPLQLDKKHQLANFADFCNECGNCDVFCPEDGGPYVLKPRFFGSLEQWSHWKDRDGFFLEKTAVHGRFSGKEYELKLEPGRALYSGEGFALSLTSDATGEISGHADAEVDLTYLHIMRWLHAALLAPGASINYVNA
jgi:putative selenate reductase